MILLDTCEILALEEFPWKRHTPQSKRYSAGDENRNYTALEALCFAVPAPYSIVAFGCNTSIYTDWKVQGQVNVVSLPGLPPLTVEGYREAAERSWNYEVAAELLVPLHELSGGIPRLLRAAHECYESCLTSTWSGVRNGMEFWRERSQRLYKKSNSSPHMYSLLLASATKFPVRESEEVILPPDVERSKDTERMSYREATEKSLCAQIRVSEKNDPVQLIAVVVPPILFPDETFGKTIPILFADGTKFDMRIPIKPSQLHPLLLEETRKHLQPTPSDRGMLFEKPFLYSLYARYLLVWWRKQQSVAEAGSRGGLDSAWIPLEEVLTGALSEEGRSKLKGIEVCLKGGVLEVLATVDNEHAVRDSLTFNGLKNPNAHHDAYIWCRLGKNQRAMALQLRHGKPEENLELHAQTFTRGKDGEDLMPLPLLVVCATQGFREVGEQRLKDIRLKGLSAQELEALRSVVFVDASAMSSTAWLKLVSSKGLEEI